MSPFTMMLSMESGSLLSVALLVAKRVPPTFKYTIRWCYELWICAHGTERCERLCVKMVAAIGVCFVLYLV